jgi:hypothetical protein
MRMPVFGSGVSRNILLSLLKSGNETLCLTKVKRGKLCVSIAERWITKEAMRGRRKTMIHMFIPSLPQH